MNPKFWRNKRVLITGHTGFKGTWLSLWLGSMGAKVAGYAFPDPSVPSMFALTNAEHDLQENTYADIRQAQALKRAVASFRPEIVFHLAAKTIERRSFAQPVETISTNVVGTATLLDALRECPSTRSIVVVTSDKCYAEKEDGSPQTEGDRLGGVSPYSASKACVEMVSNSFRQAFGMRIATARAGNVIGGGDWAEDRLIPNIMRASANGGKVFLRMPNAVRPWQHALDALCGYLMLAEALHTDEVFAESWNFGPDPAQARTVTWVAEKIATPFNVPIESDSSYVGLPETKQLRINAEKARRELGWDTRLTIETAVEWTSQWYQNHICGASARTMTLSQIESYMDKLKMREAA